VLDSALGDPILHLAIELGYLYLLDKQSLRSLELVDCVEASLLVVKCMWCMWWC
jgi:hypothetical protein